MTVVRKAVSAQPERVDDDAFEYVMSSADVDRMGDVVEQNWTLEDFQRNPIALFGHRSDFPIGTWTKVRVEGGKLKGVLKLAAAGTSQRIDEVTALVKQGILKAVSVGFRPLEHEPLKKGDGYRFKKNVLVECSLVSVPANPNALQVARSLNVSPATMDLAFGEYAGTGRDIMRRELAGEHAASPPARRAGHMTTNLSQRIEDARSNLTTLRDQLTDHVEKAGSAPDDIALTVTEELNGKIATAQRHLDGLEEAERQLVSRTVQVQRVEPEQATQYAVPVSNPRPFPRPAETVRPGEHYMRALVAAVVARGRGWRGHLDGPQIFFNALAERFGEDGRVDEKTLAAAHVVARSDGEIHVPMDVVQRAFAGSSLVQRASTAPATTTTSGWASQLVNTGYADFLNLLLPQSVFPGLAARSMRLTFGRNGIISIPSRVATPTIAGSFVAEGSPIPVRQAAVTSTTFTPKKMGVISAFTREIAEHSTPAIENLIRQWMQEDTSVSLDAVLLDTTAASSTRPAGIRNGVSGLTATAGGGIAALTGDVKQLTGALLTATNNNLRNPVWLMNPQQQLNIALTANAGGEYPFQAEIGQNRFMNYPVIVSGNITAGVVILLDAADFAVIEAGPPRFDVSDQAVLHFEDTTPLAIGTAGSPNTVAAPVRSLWQTDSMAIRMILDVNWGFVRAGALAWTSAVTW